jgi:hypothetical protein
VILVTKKDFFPKNFDFCAKFGGVQSKPGWRYVNTQRAQNVFQDNKATARSKF